MTWITSALGWIIVVGLLGLGYLFFKKKGERDHEDRTDSNKQPKTVESPPVPAGGGHAPARHRSGSGGGLNAFWWAIAFVLFVAGVTYIQHNWSKSSPSVPARSASTGSTVAPMSPRQCRLKSAPSGTPRISADADYGEAIASNQTHDSLMCSDAGQMVEFECGPAKDGPWGECGPFVHYYHARSRVKIPGTDIIAPIAPKVWFED